jgi:nitrate reductase gamma subunit
VLSKRRATAIVVAGIIFTVPGQFALSAAGLTKAFANSDARYAFGTAAWLTYTVVIVGVGLALALGLCLLLTRRLDGSMRRAVSIRFMVALVVIMVLAAVSDLGNASFDEDGNLVGGDLTPFMLFAWIAGAAWTVRLMRSVTRPATPLPE